MLSVPSCPTGVNGAQDLDGRRGPDRPLQADPVNAQGPAAGMGPEDDPRLHLPGSPPTSVRRLVYDAILGSPGNRHLHLMIGLLDALGVAAGWFLRCHEEGCGCRFCVYDKFSDWHREDVAGIRWNAKTAGSILEGAAYGRKDLDGASIGDDLRELAAVADHLDALYAAEEPGEAADGEDTQVEADEPALVGTA